MTISERIFELLDKTGMSQRSSLRKRGLHKAASATGKEIKTDPERLGVVAFDKEGHVTGIEEKPKRPKSNYVVTGLYSYPAGVTKRAGAVKLSERGELEITTLNEMHLNDGYLGVQLLGRGFAWQGFMKLSA